MAQRNRNDNFTIYLSFDDFWLNKIKEKMVTCVRHEHVDHSFFRLNKFIVVGRSELTRVLPSNRKKPE